jgi:DNA repair protein RadC
VRDLAPYDRPREKLERLGSTGLGDNELLAIVIGSGGGNQSALELANAVLTFAGGVTGLARLGPSELTTVAGVGLARAAQVLAAVELGRRTLLGDRHLRRQFKTPREMALFLMPQFGARPVEQFGIVLLDTRRRLLRTTVLAVGSLDASIVHPREVFREATLGAAAGIVLFHNHPSGDPTPSSDDIALTARLVEAGRLMGIPVLDHLILCESRYCSLHESGAV